MQTFNRKCVKEKTFRDTIGNEFTLKKGETYLTSYENQGFVMVFSTYWLLVPLYFFGDSEEFTPATLPEDPCYA